MAMKPEQKLWQDLKPHLGGHVTRVENAINNGMPDVVQIINKQVNWIELKVLPDDRCPLLRKEQFAWGMRACIEGARVIIIGAHPDDDYVIIWGFPFICESVGEAGKYVRVKSLHDFAVLENQIDDAVVELFRLRESKR